MSHPQTIIWLPAFGNTATIASVQSTTGASALVLNSNKHNSPYTLGGPYYYANVARTVSFTSGTTSNTGSTLTVTGISAAVDGNGNPTTPFTLFAETITAPAASTTVQTARIYLQINSVTTSAAVTNLSAGFGTSGITDYIFMDYNRTGWYATAQGYCPNRTTLTYSIYESLTRPETPDIAQGNLNVFPFEIPATLVVAAATGGIELVNLPTPVTLVWATVAANSTTATETFYFTVLQQGIR